MSRQSLTSPSLICVQSQALPSTTVAVECHIFSSIVERNSTPTALYLTLLSPQHRYHTQMPLPSGVAVPAIRDAFRKPPAGGSAAPPHFQLLEDRAASAAAGHASTDAVLYVRKDRREKRALLTVPLKLEADRSDRVLQDLHKLYQRLHDAAAQKAADNAARAIVLQTKLALLQHKVRAKQAVERDMEQCTALLLKEKRDELARCEAEYETAVRERREARREKARKEREERRQSPAAEVLGGADDETESGGQTTSEDEEEAESELSRQNEQSDRNPAASDTDAVMQRDDSEQHQ
ncbi:hypothetical protein MMC34_008297, partial [Xylographa carneopallida]|nr:hypothetical protein [Xylographa carneopallida]